MDLEPIIGVPKQDKYVILYDETTGEYEIARWSDREAAWIKEQGDPIQINPTHWMPLAEGRLAEAETPSRAQHDAVVNRRQSRRAIFASAALVIALCSAVLLARSFSDDINPLVEKGRAWLVEAVERNRAALLPGQAKPSIPEQTGRALASQDRQGSASQADPDPNSPAAADHRTGSSTVLSTTSSENRSSELPSFATLAEKDPLLARTVVRILPASSRETSERDVVTAQADAAEQKQALDRERRRADGLVQDLALARREVEALSARAAQSLLAAAKHEQALEEERERSLALVEDLAAARSEVEALQARLTAVTAARTEAPSLNPAAQVVSTVEHEQAFARERERAEALQRELGVAREEITALKAATSRAEASQADERQALAREREQGEALRGELAVAREEITALKAATSRAEASQAEERQALAREREQGEALRRELVVAREEITALKAAAGRAEASRAEERQALARERERTATLASELSAARTDLEARKGQLTAVDIENTSSASRKEAELVDPAAIKPSEAVSANTSPAQSARSSPESSPRAPDPTAADAKALARAEALIRQGDIKGAQLVLERAVEAGSARAAFLLAETYDPTMLAVWPTYGVRGNPQKAGELYRRAYAGGVREAKERADTLNK